MRVRRNISLLALASLLVVPTTPAWPQSLSQGLSQSQQPSEQQIEAFCANWGQLSGSQKKQYRDQYERYCRDEPVFGRPVAPQQQQQPQRQQPQKPRKPAAPEEPEQPEPAEPEPEIRPAKPEPAIPEPEPLRVDLVGELTLAGPPAREPGERQRLRVTVANQGPGGGPHAPAVNRLWARVFLSDRDVSRQGASAGAFAFSGARQGHPVRLPGLPGPGRSREVTTEVTLPAGTPEGNYWWCVQVDTRQQVEETDKGNNTACARKVVALGGKSDSELSDVFGSKVDELKVDDQVGEATRPEGFDELVAALPAKIQPAVERMSTLFVNGSLAPEPVPEGGTARVTWELPADEPPDNLWLMVSTGTLSGADCSEDLSERFEGHPDAGLRDPAEDPVKLSLDSYSPGFRYNVVGCYWKDGFFSGDWTNAVSFQYGSPLSVRPETTPSPRREAEAILNETASDMLAPKPDLVVDMLDVNSNGRIVFAVKNKAGNLDRWTRWARTYLEDVERDETTLSGSPLTLGDMPLYTYNYDLFIDGERVHDDRVRDDEEGGLRTAGPGTGNPDGVLLPGVRAVVQTGVPIPADAAEHEIRLVINPRRADGPAYLTESDYSNNERSTSVSWHAPVTLRLFLDDPVFDVLRGGDSSGGDLDKIKLSLCQVDGGCSGTGRDEGLRRVGGGVVDEEYSGRVNVWQYVDVVPRYDRGWIELGDAPVSGRFYLHIDAYDHDRGIGSKRGNRGFSRHEFELPDRIQSVAAHMDKCTRDNTLALHGGTIDTSGYSGSKKGPHLRPDKRVHVCVYRSG